MQVTFKLKSNFLKKTKYNLLINEDDINTLKKYDIDVDIFKSINELIYKIEDTIINEEMDEEEKDELDYIASTLQERNYYLNTNK